MAFNDLVALFWQAVDVNFILGYTYYLCLNLSRQYLDNVPLHERKKGSAYILMHLIL